MKTRLTPAHAFSMIELVTVIIGVNAGRDNRRAIDHLYERCRHRAGDQRRLASLHPVYQGHCAPAQAFTLIELVMAMGIMTLVLGATVSIFTVVSRSVDGITTMTEQHKTEDVLAQMQSEMRLALDFPDVSATGVTFSVPDRDNDAVDETIRYEWAGTPGSPPTSGPFTRQYNTDPAVTVLETLYDYKLGCEHRTAYPLPTPPAPVYDDSTWGFFASDVTVSSIPRNVLFVYGGPFVFDTGTAAGRRVQVLWGDNFAALNTDGKTLNRNAMLTDQEQTVAVMVATAPTP